jgi:hypothetical protein
MCPICEALLQELSCERLHYLLCRVSLFHAPVEKKIEAVTELDKAGVELRGVEQLYREHLIGHALQLTEAIDESSQGRRSFGAQRTTDSGDEWVK